MASLVARKLPWIDESCPYTTEVTKAMNAVATKKALTPQNRACHSLVRLCIARELV
jgi:hypothetical protein